MQEKIINYLRNRQSYVSGEEISRRLGISRQGFWKHVHNLRELGYQIEAIPHLGYKITAFPDRLFPYEISHALDTKVIGKKIYYFDELASTMDVAHQLAIKNTQEGTVIIAEAQKAGRGRLGREWSSPKYKGIYFSLIIKPDILPQEVTLLTLLSAVSVCEAIKNVSGLDCQIKWPNDILIENKKVCGILTEINAESDLVHYVVIGIGINVNNDKKNLIPHSTSLKEEKGSDINRIDLICGIFKSMERNYNFFKKKQLETIINKWKEFSLTLGKRIRVSYHNRQLEGEAVDIDQDGSLLLRKDNGILQKISAGDIVHCR